MAVSYIGVSNLIATNGAAPGAITPNASTLVDDLLVFFHYSAITGGNETVTVPSGFTEYFNAIVSDATGRGLLAIGYRFVKAGDTTFTASVTNHTSSNSGETICEHIHSYRGVDGNNPFNGTASLSKWTSSLNMGPISPPSVATVPAGGMAVVFAGRIENTTGQTVLSGDSLTWSTRTINDTTQGLDASCVNQIGANGTSTDQTLTSKTITTTGTAQLGAGTMFILNPAPVFNPIDPVGMLGFFGI